MRGSSCARAAFLQAQRGVVCWWISSLSQILIAFHCLCDVLKLLEVQLGEHAFLLGTKSNANPIRTSQLQSTRLPLSCCRTAHIICALGRDLFYGSRGVGSTCVPSRMRSHPANKHEKQNKAPVRVCAECVDARQFQVSAYLISYLAFLFMDHELPALEHWA